MFKTRLLSGIVLILIALLTIRAGGVVLFAVLLAISVIGMTELYNATKIREKGKYPAPVIAGYIGLFVFYGALLLSDYVKLPDALARGGGLQLLALLFTLVLLMSVYVFTYPKYHAKDAMTAFFGLVYVGVMLSFIYAARMLPGGIFHVWLIFICSWGCDTCAYCTGMLIGKHKMAPVLSPKKSVEGAVGGVLGAALLGFVFQWITDGISYEYALICAVGALISMVGDLAASAIKRNMEIKDYGNLIPGHGGILDRFDSVIFTAPIIFYLSAVLLR